MPDTLDLPLLAGDRQVVPPALWSPAITRTRGIQYHFIAYAPGGNFGPGVPVAELTPVVLNLGWQRAMNLPGMAVFTVVRPSQQLDLLEEMKTHIKIWREDATGMVPIFAGRIAKILPGVSDAIVTAWDYKALLQLSRTAYEILYPSKQIGTEIVLPEWTTAKNTDKSPLGFVSTGIVEDPLGTDNTTPIKVGEDFGLTFMNRLFVFYMLAEMAMANTANNVVFDISVSEPHTFSFRRNAGEIISHIDFTCPGNVISFDMDRGGDRIRNDRATVISDEEGDVEYAVTDSTSIDAYGRLQDAVSPRTLVGENTGTTETDQTKAIMARLLKEGIRTPKAILFQVRQGEFTPFVDIDLGDKVKVTLANDSNTYVYDGYVRVTAFAAGWTPGSGELIQMQGRGVDA